MKINNSNTDAQSCIASIEQYLSNHSGQDYLDYFVRSLREIMGLALCCVYEYQSDVNHKVVKALCASVEKHDDTADFVRPSLQLVNQMAERGKYIGKIDEKAISQGPRHHGCGGNGLPHVVHPPCSR